MQYQHVLLLETNLLPPLILDYLSGSENLKKWYSYEPTPENFLHQIEQKKHNYINRKILSEVLQSQYSKLQKSEQLSINLSLVCNENTYTVTTAHQTNVFTGPLYYIYKILHVIKLSDELKKLYPQYNFLPIYWMGSEDHDFEEINHIFLSGDKIEWKNNIGGVTGRLNPNSLVEPLSVIKTALENEPYLHEIIHLFEYGYKNYTSLSDATRYILNELFGNYGLIVVNADEPKLKQLITKVIKDELTNEVVYNSTLETISYLEQEGYKVQAKPRAINLFYLENNLRERIVYNDSGFYEVLNINLKFSKKEILQLAESQPEKFSPNVFLRPLYQETVLPNLAYVGGSGELSYWLEQKNIFQYFKVSFPLLMLRNSFLLVDLATQKKLQKLNLPITDFLLNEDSLVKKYIELNSDLPSFDFEKNELRKLFHTIKEKAVTVDATLQATVDAHLKQALNNLENLEKKITKAEKNKQDVAINQLKSVRQKFMPNNTFQERHENILSFYSKYGNKLLNDLYNAIQPFEANLNIINLP